MTDSPIVLIHGFPFNGAMWKPVRPHLGGGPILAPDLPGMGAAQTVSGPGIMAAYAEAVITSMEEAGLARAVIGGLSMGGYVLFELFRRHPERFEGVILMHTRAAADDLKTVQARNLTVNLVRTEGPASLANSMLPKLFSPDPDPGKVDFIRRMIEGTDPDGLVFGLEAMRDRVDSSATLRTMHLPALVIAGDHDVITPAAEMKAMAADLPITRFRQIAGVGHLGPVEKPEETARVIRSWMADLS